MPIEIGYCCHRCYIYEIEVEVEQDSTQSIYACYSTNSVIVRNIHTITDDVLPFRPTLKINKKYNGYINYYKIKEIPRDKSLIADKRSINSPLHSNLLQLNYRNLALFKNGYTNIIKLYYDNGNLHTQFFVNNNRIEGKYIQYYRDGITKYLDVDFVNGKIHGEYKIFGNDNSCLSIDLYNNGELYEQNLYYPDGNLRIKTQYNKYKEKHGLEYEYVYNNIVTILPYNNGIINGDKIKFWPNGKIRYLIQYKNGKRDGNHIEYDENEKIRYLIEYKNNKILNKE